ncbi:DUF6907 domain-containing protein [Actinoplanes sp. NPDC049316]|uniref:DUF6907 domain-containing protein n=1 Tax=Actinoplanes sp. NPDC049316 TaxID=3154727 RepID=UPI00343E10B0
MTIVCNPTVPGTAPALDLRVQRPAGGPWNLTAHRGGQTIADLTRTVNTPGEAFAAAQRITDAAAIAAGPCPAWCVTGPHEPYPTDRLDDGARLHTGTDTVLAVGGGCGPLQLEVSPQWMQGGDEPPQVRVVVAEDHQEQAEMLLTVEQAEGLAAELLAAAVKLRATAATAPAAR